jgi:NTP-dependent ternary system trypsin peptidase co-occuring protein
MPQIPLSEAIQQLRDELREAIVEGADKDIVFTPNSVDIDLSVRFRAEAKVGGGFKLLAFLDLSSEGSVGLCGKVGDGVNQAADLILATASIPSLNFIRLTTFGNWF